MTVEERIRGRKIGVIGMARSGLAAALLAKEMGGIPFISDSGRAEKLTAQAEQLERSGIPFETGGHTERLQESDYVVNSPGVPLTAPVVVTMQERGIPIFSEIEFASWVCQGRIVGVTGSNGKTTTTTLVGEICRAAGLDTVVCGNIGLPFAEVARRVSDRGVAVVEVSNFQLETIADFRPFVAAILNITPDHLDRHGTMDVYEKIKYRITENQGENDYLVLNADDAVVGADRIETAATKSWFSAGAGETAAAFVRDGGLWLRREGHDQFVVNTRDILIPGPHNLQNAAAAVVMASLLDISETTMAGVLRTFAGVEHRLERVGNVAGVAFINDSKATNVDSVSVALQSVATPLYLIAGGREKGAPYTPLIEAGRGRIKGIIAIGEAKEKIFQDLGREFPVQFADTLEAAVKQAFDLAIQGETVLLSPACASFDMFKNYEERGRAFKAAVANLKNGKKDHNQIPS